MFFTVDATCCNNLCNTLKGARSRRNNVELSGLVGGSLGHGPGACVRGKTYGSCPQDRIPKAVCLIPGPLRSLIEWFECPFEANSSPSLMTLETIASSSGPRPCLYLVYVTEFWEFCVLQTLCLTAAFRDESVFRLSADVFSLRRNDLKKVRRVCEFHDSHCACGS